MVEDPLVDQEGEDDTAGWGECMYHTRLPGSWRLLGVMRYK